MNDLEENEKHIKYKNKYKPNEIFWGIGIENEVYLEFDKKIFVPINFFLKNHRRERYSVDYFSNYNKKYIDDYFYKYVGKCINDKNIPLPLLINSHSFLYTDYNNNSMKMYTKENEPNKKFIGETLIQTLEKQNEYFKDNEEWLFDGDTIEFTTNSFYNNKLYNIIEELNEYKTKFIKQLNETCEKLEIFKDYGKIKIMKENYAFSMYMTNLSNISMFNNGTLHYNITLPTLLDKNTKIKNKKEFLEKHKKGIQIIQWLEPFLISIYGTSDPFSNIDDKNIFSKSSQRCAISRYIGIGTYNTDNMDNGKILTIDSTVSKWYNDYYKNNGYTKLDKIGLDINFNKHYNHGIEIRFFDYMDDDNLEESFTFIILLLDFVLDKLLDKTLENPIYNEYWNNFVINSLKFGRNYILTNEEKEIYEKLFNFSLYQTTINSIYYEIYDNLENMYFDNDSNLYVGLFSCYTLNNN